MPNDKKMGKIEVVEFEPNHLMSLPQIIAFCIALGYFMEKQPLFRFNIICDNGSVEINIPVFKIKDCLRNLIAENGEIEKTGLRDIIEFACKTMGEIINKGIPPDYTFPPHLKLESD